MINSNLDDRLKSDYKISRFESNDKKLDIQNLMSEDVIIITSSTEAKIIPSTKAETNFCGTVDYKKKSICGIPVNFTDRHIERIPKEVEGVYYIVPEQVQYAYPYRKDLLSVSNPVYLLGDDSGVLGYTSLCRLL